MAFKEVKAFQDMILPEDYDDPIDGVDFWTDSLDLIYGFDLILEGGGHDHIVNIPGWRVKNTWYDDKNDEYHNGPDYIITEDCDTANSH